MVSKIKDPSRAIPAEKRIELYRLAKQKEFQYKEYIWRKIHAKSLRNRQSILIGRKKGIRMKKVKVRNPRAGKPFIKKIAEQLNIHYNTVRKYLKEEHEKTRKYQKKMYHKDLIWRIRKKREFAKKAFDVKTEYANYYSNQYKVFKERFTKDTWEKYRQENLIKIKNRNKTKKDYWDNLSDQEKEKRMKEESLHFFKSKSLYVPKRKRPQNCSKCGKIVCKKRTGGRTKNEGLLCSRCKSSLKRREEILKNR